MRSSVGTLWERCGNAVGMLWGWCGRDCEAMGGCFVGRVGGRFRNVWECVGRTCSNLIGVGLNR
ncbi:MAG: hypothetical protein H7237_08945 [Alkalinema sp. FL-bin-369]|nr:hypothetical protein [Leptolyngbyaceae cyanobacterium LF-bin-369]